MPWCDDCSKYWAPSAMQPDGSCPTCGRRLAVPVAAGADPAKISLRELAGEKKAPWHFKLLVVLVVVYLVWRIVQMIGWIVG
jgi:hypothetical protein